jgi:plastocyanin
MTVAVPSVCSGQQVTATAQVELSSNVTTRSADASGVVMWLTRLGDSTQSQVVSGQQRHQLLQKRRSFSPHLLVIQVGSAVDFPNQDPFFHNVFSLFEGKRFDLGLYEAGSSRSVAFNRAGISYIFCNIHPEMSAVVVALNTPYYGISDRKGMIRIPNVPYGRYQMQVWHERVLPDTLNSLTRTIAISDQSGSLGVLHLPEQRNLSALHKNKYGQDYDNPTPGSPVYTRP